MSAPLPVIPPECLEQFRLISTGRGFCIKAFLQPQDAEVSLKLLTRHTVTENDLQELLKEVARARCIQPDRVLHVIGFYQFQGLRGLLTKWMPGGSLHSLIHQPDVYPELPLCVITRILSDMAEGLCHLHSLRPPLLHQGLKPSNILLDATYRAKIMDYGLAHWRKQNLRSVSLTSSNAETSDLVYLSPETLRGDSPTTAGDVYSFGMTSWEALSRKKPYEGKTTMLKVLTGVSNGLRPGTDEEFIAIPSTIPQRHSLVQLINLCWHSDPDIRPAITECVYALQRILDSFPKEMVSSAVYNLMQAKDKAVNACKASADPHSVQIDIHNLAISYGQASSKVMLKPKPEFRTRSMTVIPLVDQECRILENGISLGSTRNSFPQTEKRHDSSVPCSRGPALQTSFSTPPTSICRTGHAAAVPCGRSTGAAQIPGPGHTVQQNGSSNQHSETSTGLCCRGSCCQILTSQRETILTCMTEGCLNNILDILQSHRVLAKADYELITSYPTLTGRARAMLDICLCIGESVAHIVVTVLLSNKCCPLISKQLQLSLELWN
ncbi:receptor-interacting serine/threonine-protein kinase 2-like isoform X1 [Lissotriton helveticus]